MKKKYWVAATLALGIGLTIVARLMDQNTLSIIALPVTALPLVLFLIRHSS